MTKYKCGHDSNGIIILDDNELSMLNYLTWSDTKGVFGTRELCFDCYCNKDKQKEAKYINNV